MCQITINGITKDYPKGTAYGDIAAEYRQEYAHDIILAKVDGRLQELFKTVEQDCNLSFVTTAEEAGHSTYIRGMILLMLRAMYRVGGRLHEKAKQTENSILQTEVTGANSSLQMEGNSNPQMEGSSSSQTEENSNPQMEESGSPQIEENSSPQIEGNSSPQLSEKGAKESWGGHMIKRVRIKYALGAGLYGEIEWRMQNPPQMSEFLTQVKEEMERLVEQNLPIKKRTVSTEKAARLFHEYGMYEKERLFRYRLVSNTNLYELDDFCDYYYGYMPPSTGMLKMSALSAYEGGFLLLLPEKKTPEILTEFKPRKKLYDVLQQSSRWAAAMNLENVGDLNKAISSGDINDLILVQEAYQEKKIAEIAGQVRQSGNKKFIMIAGPSSSGKTTFSHRLSIQLRTLGYKPHPIAVDDYFVNREDTPKDEFGKYNFEILEAIDIELFNRDMNALLHGERVELPTFNFKTGKREYKGNYKQLGAEDILVIEGIHCLNDALSYSLPRESKFKIYISALTQLNVDEHNRIATTDGRLIRRIVRDARTRGTAAKDTVAMWPSVRRGEEENIFPFQEDADCMFNSALIYELSVLKQFAEPLLFGIERDCAEYTEAKRLLKFLDYFLGVSSEEVPKNSILREFVGGSCFKV